jgi:hypothetical protein
MDNALNIAINKVDACFSTMPVTAYQQLISLNNNSFQLLVFDPDKNKFIAFIQKSFSFKQGYNVYMEHLKTFLNENELVNLSYKDTLVIWESQHSTLVPSVLFDAKEQDAYFHFNQSADKDEKICADKLKNAETYNIYSVPAGLEGILKLDSLRIRHHATVFIEAMMIFSKNKISSKLVFVDVHSAFFDMLIIENNRLLFYNSFAYKTPEDFIYFVLFVFEQLKLSPELDGIILSGEILKNSALSDILYKYVRNIDFALPNEQFVNSYILKDLPAHTFNNLSNAVLCEL